MEIRT